jgi:two-component system OmpR family response regulator
MPGCVLVVDDDATSRELLAEFLRDAGYDVVSASDCAEAVVAAAGPRTVDLAVLDMNLPDGDGLELLASLRALRPDLRALILSGVDEGEVRAMAAQRGLAIDGCITKPFSLALIAGRLESLVPQS